MLYVNVYCLVLFLRDITVDCDKQIRAIQNCRTVDTATIHPENTAPPLTHNAEGLPPSDLLSRIKVCGLCFGIPCNCEYMAC